ncbi:MAG: TA system VapC family ribonuclease toxin [Bauldia sp.]
MMLPDVNVLIFAFREETSQHEICRRWLQSVVEGDSQFAVSTLALSALVRVTTNGRSYPRASSIESALGFCDDVLALPNCQVVEPGDRHWGIFSRLCVEAGIRGPMVTDAWYAALAIEWGCEWITLDRDFARFPGLRWRTPDA